MMPAYAAHHRQLTDAVLMRGDPGGLLLIGLWYCVPSGWCCGVGEPRRSGT